MSYPLEYGYPTGNTIYAIVHHPDGRVANMVNEAFEAFNAADWTEYALPLTEQGTTGYYRAAMPQWVLDAEVLTSEALYAQGGGAPAVSDGPPSLGQSQGSPLAAIRDSVPFAKNLEQAVGSEKRGEVIAGTISTTQVSTDLADAEDDVYIRRSIIFTSGPAIRQAARITAYDAGTAVLTFDIISTAPEDGDTFIIV